MKFLKWLFIFLISISLLLPPSIVVATGSTDGPEYVEGELLVRFSPGAARSAATKAAVHNENGATVLNELNIVPGVQHIKLPPNVPVHAAIKRYEKNPNILYAEPNYIVQATETIPNDEFFHTLWGLQTIRAPEAWSYTTGSSDVVIAVLDTGVDHNHPDLKENVLLIPGSNFADSKPDTMDFHGHGTHVAGTIAARGNNEIGIAGVMWEASIMPVKVLGDGGTGSVMAIALGVEHAVANGADIINMSLGFSMPVNSVRDAILAASDSLVVVSAGNDSNNLNTTAYYPASFNLPNMINVAATNSADNLAHFSNYGSPSVHVAAPGTSIYSTIPGGYTYYQGTSMAAPHVAGLAGLVKSINPELTATEIKTVIEDSADSITSLTGKVSTGGRINALAALELALPEIPAEIPDNDLQQAIREALEKPTGNITITDMEQLTTLNAPGANITDLTGLEQAPNLTTLNLSGNNISSITSLLSLNNLQSLDITLNKLDLTPDSQALLDISNLINNGVDVTYDPQEPDFISEAEVTPEDNIAAANGVTLQFSSVSGTVSINRRSSPARPAPSGFRFVNSYFKITAESFEDDVLVTIPYDPTKVDNPNNLRVIHYDSSQNKWEDITVAGSVDTTNHTITGITSSFSEIYGAEATTQQGEAPPPAYGQYGLNTNLLWIISVSLLFYGITLTRNRKPKYR
ncbi:S8 family serine peptidase [Dethiobacter alkaliphilus]|uniref:S8 family serine peptidase n=1 Tax=Dethiobacter alkaliphilus TaxID=427926 RepID=UPI002227C6AE|nr:S8 family serine peptidase [Dethiobacter alkaliphilus]MCW3491313.1 S8 family serine peptidase [Dethiobacter alkaliphilus]